jgi:hypothetical protein
VWRGKRNADRVEKATSAIRANDNVQNDLLFDSEHDTFLKIQKLFG